MIKILKKPVFIILSTVNNLYCQNNLLPNYSFEEMNDCPQYFTSFHHRFSDHVNSWVTDFLNVENYFNSDNTPDYYNTCSTQIFSSIPQNSQGNQSPIHGNSYVGLSFVSRGNHDSREYILARLNEPLISGQAYSFTMYVSLADNSFFGINKLGAAFLPEVPFNQIAFNYQIVTLSNIIPQICFNEIVTEKDDWAKLNASFIAQGNEVYIAIGHFNNRETTNKIVLDQEQASRYGVNDFECYYYVDLVELVPRDGLDNKIQINDAIKLFPNPTENLITITGLENHNNIEIKIYDINGRLLKIQENEATIDVAALSASTYAIHVINNGNIIYKTQFVKK